MTEPIRLIDLGELVGRSEIAERAGIRVKTVDSWRRLTEAEYQAAGDAAAGVLRILAELDALEPRTQLAAAFLAALEAKAAELESAR
jgi:hypothetical protein